MKKRWSIILNCVVLVGVGIVMAGLWDTYWVRAIRFVARLEVKNASPEILDDVTILAQDSGGRKHSSVAERLQPGETLRLNVKTSDLYLVSVTWNLRGRGKSFSDDGLACPGETYHIRLLGDGRAETWYQR